MTCAIPKSPRISSGEIKDVYDMDRVRHTVALPAQSSAQAMSVKEPAKKDPPRWMTAATLAVVLADDATVSTRTLPCDSVNSLLRLRV